MPGVSLWYCLNEIKLHLKIASPGCQLLPGNSYYYFVFTNPIDVKITGMRKFPNMRNPLFCKMLVSFATFPILVWSMTSLFAVAAALHALLYLNLSRCCLTDDGCEKFSSEFIFLWFIYLLLSFHLAYYFRFMHDWFHSDHNIQKFEFNSSTSFVTLL